MLVVICAQLALVSVSWLGCFRPGILALFGPGVSSGQFILTRDCLIIPGYTARDLARAKCVRVLTVDVLAKIWRRGDPRRSQTHLLFRSPTAAATAAGGAPRPCVPNRDCMACFCGKRGRPVDQVRVHINKRVYFPIQRRPFLIMCMEIHCDIAQKKIESN